jgi:hypothetical protein
MDNDLLTRARASLFPVVSCFVSHGDARKEKKKKRLFIPFSPPVLWVTALLCTRSSEAQI